MIFYNSQKKRKMRNTNLKPMLIATLAHLATNYKISWDSAKTQVQKVIDLYNKTGLPALNSDDLHLLFNDTENMLYNKQTGNKEAHLTIGKDENRGHLSIDRKAAMNMISKPEGYSELLAGIKECNKICLTGSAPSYAWNV